MSSTETPSYRSTASFGKRMEYVVIGELLKRGFDVYMTLVDDQQIDCILRFPDEPPIYVDVQIKARSKTAKNKGLFTASTLSPRKNYIFVFYDEKLDTYWVIPSLDVVREGNTGKSGRTKGRVQIKLANHNKNGWKARPKFDIYKDKFEHLIPPHSAWKMDA